MGWGEAKVKESGKDSTFPNFALSHPTSKGASHGPRDVTLPLMEHHFQLIVLGTGLTESIAAA